MSHSIRVSTFSTLRRTLARPGLSAALQRGLGALALAGAALLGAPQATWAAVDANAASQADLETVSGIGPALSSKILAERGKGSFKDWNDLVDRVRGVGPGSAARLSANGLTVGGQAYTAAADAPTALSRSRSRHAAADGNATPDGMAMASAEGRRSGRSGAARGGMAANATHATSPAP